MDNIITDDTKRHIKEIARDSIFELKPICNECWNNDIDDPLGEKSNKNTSCNKSMNAIVNHLLNVNNLPNKEYNNVKSKLEVLFYKNRNILTKENDKIVKNKLKCWYCFEKRKSNDKKLSIYLEDIEGQSEKLFGKSNNEWR